MQISPIAVTHTMPGVSREGVARLQQYILVLLLFRQQKRKLRGAKNTRVLAIEENMSMLTTIWI